MKTIYKGIQPETVQRVDMLFPALFLYSGLPLAASTTLMRKTKVRFAGLYQQVGGATLFALGIAFPGLPVLNSVPASGQQYIVLDIEYTPAFNALTSASGYAWKARYLGADGLEQILSGFYVAIGGLTFTPNISEFPPPPPNTDFFTVTEFSIEQED